MLETDEYHMRRALRLAVLGRETAPNPMVGCVLADPSGNKIAEGYHMRCGEAHAEVNALSLAGRRARGATAYVTLEPCSVHSKTPPCADALIAVGVARVVVAMVDPDKRVLGRGIARLREAGIEVDVGLCEEQARDMNRAFIKHRTSGMPFVTVKTAMTLDGKVATVAGDSRWITGEQTRKWVHRQLRARTEAILVGVGTVLADDPELGVRLSGPLRAHAPLRVIVDSRLRTPLGSKLVRQASRDGRTVIAYTQDTDNCRQRLEDAGVTLIACSPDSAGKVDLRVLLARLGHESGLSTVLVEAGPAICASLFSLGIVDRYYSCIAPKLVGGSDSPGPIGGKGLVKAMDFAIQPDEVVVRRSGRDYVARCEFYEKV